jgi:hypothetical protein
VWNCTVACIPTYVPFRIIICMLRVSFLFFVLVYYLLREIWTCNVRNTLSHLTTILGIWSCGWMRQELQKLRKWNACYSCGCLRLYSPLLDVGRVFSFLGLLTIKTPWQPVERPLPRCRATQTQNKHTQTSTPWVGFEPTIPAFDRAKTVHALDCAATVIGYCCSSY